MNARLTPFGQLLAASHDYHGIALDLYGVIGADGYEVAHVVIPGSLVAITECVSANALEAMNEALDRLLPSSEQLRAASAFEARADIVKWNRDMEVCGWAGMS